MNLIKTFTLRKTFAFLILSAFLFVSCGKDELPEPEPAEPMASGTAIQTFHKADAFYQMYVYRFDEDENAWTKRIGSHFSTIPVSDSTYLGFSNPYVEESGVSLFDMPKLYAAQIGSSNTKTAKINVEKVLQFFPSEEGSKKGTVKILAQDVTISKSATATFEPGTPTFKIGISGEGAYDEDTKVIDLEVIFNETAIGGQAAVKRKYKMSPEALTLN